METIINPSNPKETITYNRIGGTPENPIYFNDALKPSTQPAIITPQSLTPAPKVNVPSIQTTSPTEVLTTVPTRAQSDIEQARLEAERIQQAGGGESEKARNTLLESVRSLFGDRDTALNQQATIEEQAGIGEQRKILNEVNSQIAEQNIALRAEQDRIRNAPMSAAQKQIEVNAIENDYGRRLADLAIRQSAARGNIEGIQQDAERKTKLLLAPIDNQIEYFKTFGMANVDALSKKEQEKLQLIVTNLQNKRKEVQDLQKAKTELITEISNNGGGSSQFISQINGASTLEDAYAIAAKSGFIGKLDRLVKEAQLSKIRAEMAKDVAKEKPVSPMQLAQSQSKVATITDLVSSEAIRSAVGPTKLGRFIGRGIDVATGARQNFIAGVEQVTSQLTIDQLSRAKAEGATFGSLTEGERQAIADAATKINNWAIKPNGKVTGYNASEKDFKRELDKINNFAKLDFVLKGGDPTQVGITLTENGYETVNSDGSITIF